jgi:hypothetical protein
VTNLLDLTTEDVMEATTSKRPISVASLDSIDNEWRNSAHLSTDFANWTTAGNIEVDTFERPSPSAQPDVIQEEPDEDDADDIAALAAQTASKALPSSAISLATVGPALTSVASRPNTVDLLGADDLMTPPQGALSFEVHSLDSPSSMLSPSRRQPVVDLMDLDVPSLPGQSSSLLHGIVTPSTDDGVLASTSATTTNMGVFAPPYQFDPLNTNDGVPPQPAPAEYVNPFEWDAFVSSTEVGSSADFEHSQKGPVNLMD